MEILMETRNKRDIIKNVLIIFLIVMLLLTFFSNTIMNKSLPEVATQYASYKQISDRIRTTATVIANEDYSVVLDDAREIVEVKVRRGDRVERGQVLFVLDERDSSAISQAETELNNLLIQREQFMLEGSKSESDKYTSDIDKVKADLAKLDLKITPLPDGSAPAQTLEEEIEAIELLVEAKNKELTKLRGKMTTFEQTYDSEEEVLGELNNNRILYFKAKEEYEAAKEEYDSAKEEIEELELEIEKLREEIDSYTKKKLESEELLAGLKYTSDDISVLKAAMDEAKIELNAVKREYEMFLDMMEARDEYNSASEEEKAEKEQAYLEAKAAYEDFTGRTEGNYRSESEYLELCELKENKVENAEDEYYDAVYIAEEASEYEEDIARYESAIKKRNNKIDSNQKNINSLNKDLEKLTEEKNLAEEAMKKLEAEVMSGESQSSYLELSVEVEGIEAEIKEYEKQKTYREEKTTLLEKIEELEGQKATEDKDKQYNDNIYALQLQNLNKSITQKQKELANLRKTLADNQIISPVTGTISSIGYNAGEEIPAGGVACKISLSEKGYTMEFAATNEQCQQIRVGDRAELQNYYWGTTPEITVSGFKNDPSNPGRGKIVVLTVMGDVEAGQSLTFALGNKSRSYDKVVPSSAVREDSNGKFILVVDSKSTPLGNRYTARRVDVQVIASDATSSALSGELLGGEFVITTSSAPVSDGMQVRLADTN